MQVEGERLKFITLSARSYVLSKGGQEEMPCHPPALTERITMPLPPQETLDKLYFNVRTQELHTPDLTNLPRHRAIARVDTGEVLSVVSDRYKLIQNKDIFSPIFEYLEESQTNYEFKKFQLIRDGLATYIDIVLPDKSISITPKLDDLHMRIVMFNSYDKTRSFGFIIGAFRIICSNGMVIGTRMGSIVHKHMTDFSKEDSGEMIKTGIERFDVYGANWKGLAEQPITLDEGNTRLDLIQKHLKLSEKNLKRVQDNWSSVILNPETKRTNWDLYNSLTETVTVNFKRMDSQIKALKIIDKSFLNN